MNSLLYPDFDVVESTHEHTRLALPLVAATVDALWAAGEEAPQEFDSWIGPSPGSLRDPTSPRKRGEGTEAAARPNVSPLRARKLLGTDGSSAESPLAIAPLGRAATSFRPRFSRPRALRHRARE